MAELQAEFGDLGVEESKAKEFAIAIGNRLQEIAANVKSKPAKKIESVVSVSTGGSEKKTMGPLRTSRGGEPSSTPNTTGNAPIGNSSGGGSTRLLQTALQSSRGNNNDRSGNGPNQRGTFLPESRDVGRGAGQKRNFNDNNSRQDFSRDNRARRDVLVQPFRQQQQAQGNAGGAPVSDTVQYFEQMNKVAQASGFKNAQEMIASQKEMMALMQGGPASMGVPPGPMQGFPAAGGFPNMQQGQFPGGPPPPPGYPPHHFNQGGYQGRGGRGFGRGFGRGAGAFGREGWEAGRGRGRGGRGPPLPPPADGSVVPPGDNNASVATSTTAADGSSLEAATAGSAVGGDASVPVPATGSASEGFYQGGGRGYQGRGGRGRGRGWYQQGFDPSGGYGRFGRGSGRGGAGGRFHNNAPGAPPTIADGSAASAPAHKTWVRSPDLDNALVTGR
eukprot:CAMPEP_0170364610 /NCGR_PEP_ID=MMETSP0117_2-20130122/5466_1 /TAXON_ID=400756 /ORGANISM="Durinskia baltica, Strain CSIRO CS-38" /LENGTH=445 /DNA_ID=CAMNT_0010619123 /DNA_START=180 /DNA_END=1517 /DNA_ORIENTATION=+